MWLLLAAVFTCLRRTLGQTTPLASLKVYVGLGDSIGQAGVRSRPASEARLGEKRRKAVQDRNLGTGFGSIITFEANAEDACTISSYPSAHIHLASTPLLYSNSHSLFF